MVLEEPPEEAYQEATDFCVETAQEIDVNLFTLKHCLAEGYPFVFGLTLFESFDAMDEGGYIPMPSAEETSRSSHGAHAMICVGYDDQEEVFIIRNSWGEDWGDNGYCYIPYAYMTDTELCWDCWAIQSVSDLDYEADGLEEEVVEDEVTDEEVLEEEVVEDEEAVDDSYEEEVSEDDEEDDDEYESEDEVSEDIYVVQSGDSLYSIAAQIYGDGELWRDLYEANIETIGDDPDYIEVGLELFLPDL